MTQPSVYWAQRSSSIEASKNVLFVFVEAADVKPETLKLDITPEAVKLSGSSTTKEYALDLKLYAKIDPAQSTHSMSGRGVDFVLRKAEIKDEFWPRLLETTQKLHWLKTDFGKWVDEDEQDEPEQESEAAPGPGGPPGGPGGFDMSQLANMGLDPAALQGLDPAALQAGLGGASTEGADDNEDDDEDEAEMPELEDPEQKAGGKNEKKIEEIS